jgi:hypothetical protein
MARASEAGEMTKRRAPAAPAVPQANDKFQRTNDKVVLNLELCGLTGWSAKRERRFGAHATRGSNPARLSNICCYTLCAPRFSPYLPRPCPICLRLGSSLSFVL